MPPPMPPQHESKVTLELCAVAPADEKPSRSSSNSEDRARQASEVSLETSSAAGQSSAHCDVFRLASCGMALFRRSSPRPAVGLAGRYSVLTLFIRRHVFSELIARIYLGFFWACRRTPLIAGGVIPEQPRVLVGSGRLPLKCLVQLGGKSRDLLFPREQRMDCAGA